jgi:hypothetical protein
MKKISIHGPCQINRIQNDNNKPKEENDTAGCLVLSNASHSAVGKKNSFLFSLSLFFKKSHAKRSIAKSHCEKILLKFSV